jgi:hypothetical protein
MGRARNNKKYPIFIPIDFWEFPGYVSIGSGSNPYDLTKTLFNK